MSALRPCEHDLPITGCKPCTRTEQREESYRRWGLRHQGHDIILDPAGRRACRDCHAQYSLDRALIQQVIDGAPGGVLSHAERARVIPALRGRGLTGVQIAQRLGCTDRTVWRALKRARQEVAS